MVKRKLGETYPTFFSVLERGEITGNAHAHRISSGRRHKVRINKRSRRVSSGTPMVQKTRGNSYPHGRSITKGTNQQTTHTMSNPFPLPDQQRRKEPTGGLVVLCVMLCCCVVCVVLCCVVLCCVVVVAGWEQKLKKRNGGGRRRRTLKPAQPVLRKFVLLGVTLLRRATEQLGLVCSRRQTSS